MPLPPSSPEVAVGGRELEQDPDREELGAPLDGAEGRLERLVAAGGSDLVDACEVEVLVIDRVRQLVGQRHAFQEVEIAVGSVDQLAVDRVVEPHHLPVWYASSASRIVTESGSTLIVCQATERRS